MNKKNIAPTEVRKVLPHQLAWLRRPEKDTPQCEVWELPDGQLYCHDRKQGQLMLAVSSNRRRPLLENKL